MDQMSQAFENLGQVIVEEYSQISLIRSHWELEILFQMSSSSNYTLRFFQFIMTVCHGPLQITYTAYVTHPVLCTHLGFEIIRVLIIWGRYKYT